MTECVLISGHTGGLGTELAKQFKEHGYHVVGIDWTVSEEYRSVCVDLSRINEIDAEQLREELLDCVDGHPIRALINNAAVQRTGPIEDIELDAYIESMNVNVLGPLLLTRAILPELRSTHGTVLNIGSIHTRLSKPGFSPYSISKSALNGLSRALAIEIGAEVRIIELQPAAISTKMLEDGFAKTPELRRQLDDYHPSGRIGTPAEVAGVAVTLVESEAHFLNGSILSMDGGIGARLHDPG